MPSQAIVLRKSDLPAYTSVGVVIGHVMAWAVFVGLPLIPIFRQPELVAWELMRQHLVLSIRSAVFFYLIYGVFIPRFLACGGLVRYFLALGVVSAFVGAGTVAIDSLSVSQFGFVPTSFNPRMSAWQSFTLMTTYNGMLGFIALAGRFTFDWFAISRAYHRYQILRNEHDTAADGDMFHVREVHEAVEATQANETQGNPVVSAADGAAIPRQGSIWVRSGGETVRVDLDRLWYVEGMKDYVAYVGPWGKTLVYQRLKDVENGLPGREFRRVHRSYIVAWAKVERFSGTHIVVAGRELPVGATYRSKI